MTYDPVQYTPQDDSDSGKSQSPALQQARQSGAVITDDPYGGVSFGDQAPPTEGGVSQSPALRRANASAAAATGLSYTKEPPLSYIVPPKQTPSNIDLSNIITSTISALEKSGPVGMFGAIMGNVQDVLQTPEYLSFLTDFYGAASSPEGMGEVNAAIRFGSVNGALDALYRQTVEFGYEPVTGAALDQQNVSVLFDENDFRQIYAEIDELETTEIEVEHFTRYGELFHYPLALGLVLIVLEMGLASTVLRKLP